MRYTNTQSRPGSNGNEREQSRYDNIKMLPPEEWEKSITSDFVISNIIGLEGRVFVNGPGDQGSVPGLRPTKDLKNGTWYLLTL